MSEPISRFVWTTSYSFWGQTADALDQAHLDAARTRCPIRVYGDGGRSWLVKPNGDIVAEGGGE